MREENLGLLDAPPRHSRLIGRYGQRDVGPAVIVVGGIHGNEPSGVRAVTRVIERLERDRPELRGELVALAGNLSALQRGERFIDADLNRIWTDERVEELAATNATESAEDKEQRELHGALAEVVNGNGNGHSIVFIDLHTSSADGDPFLTIGDTIRNRRLAMQIPLPIIIGLEEQVDGALLEYMNNRGHVTLGVEGGQHDAPASVDFQEAVIWLVLISIGLLDRDALPDARRFHDRLWEASRDVPPIIEIRHRHAIVQGDGFRMEPGFRNFQPVVKGQFLARDNRGSIHAVESGVIVLPLYQGLGDDGFFIGREVRPFWLKLSAVLRRMRLDHFLHVLPGVTRDPTSERRLIVDTRIARFYPLEIFHLFGYRKRRMEGSRLVVSRRRFDLEGLAED